jgi:Protein of unknown function (DUF2934)
MATPKRARVTSSTTRSKKAATPQAQEITTRPQSQVNLEELIRFRAYQLYEQRGGNHGYDLEDWLRAEHELTGRLAQSA